MASDYNKSITIGKFSGELMGKIQPGARIDPRMTPKVVTPDLEMEPGQKFMLIALAQIRRELQLVGRKLVSTYKRVDEYQIVGGYAGDSTAIVEVQPQFDTIAEMIESVLITGPVSTAFTVQLGDRNWTLTTNTTGLAVIAPVGIMLTRNDRRLLTGASAGNWTLELMGHADERY